MKNKLQYIGAAAALICALNTSAQSDTVYVQKPAPTTVVQQTVVEERDHDHDEPTLRVGEVGIRWMPTFYSLMVRNSNNETVSTSLSMSHGWGAFIGINFSRYVGIVGEVNYLEVNQKYKDMNLQRTVKINYLNIPVLLSLNTNKMAPVNLNFVVGPQFGLNVGSSVKTSGGDADTVRATVAAKPGDVGVAYGAGLEIGLTRDKAIRLDIGFRGYYGFVDIRSTQTSSNPDAYNVLVKASRKAYAGYLGLAFMF